MRALQNRTLAQTAVPRCGQRSGCKRKGAAMSFEDLDNPELQEKLRACKTTDELLAVAREEGIELSDVELQGVAGGIDETMCAAYCGEYTVYPEGHFSCTWVMGPIDKEGRLLEGFHCKSFQDLRAGS